MRFTLATEGTAQNAASNRDGGAPKLGLKPQLEHKGDEIDARDISRIWIGTPEGGEPVFARVGRYSPFVEQVTARRHCLMKLLPMKSR